MNYVNINAADAVVIINTVAADTYPTAYMQMLSTADIVVVFAGMILAVDVLSRFLPQPLSFWQHSCSTNSLDH